jgi:hypothetical protein
MTHYTKRILRDLGLLALLAGVCLGLILIAQHLENKPKTKPKAIVYPIISNYKPLKTN